MSGLLRHPWGDLLPVLGLALLLWLLSLRLRDASIMDIAWGPGFLVLAAWHAAGAGAHLSLRGGLVLALCAVWSLRLAWHIGARHGGREDARYRRWREQSGAAWWWKSLLKVFLLQGAVLWLVARPLAEAIRRPGEATGWLTAAGVLLALGGLVYESVADRQLQRFRSRPDSRGGICREGLWRFSRHPNYFGEALVWWGIFLTAAATGAWWTLVSPLLMTWLLRFGSGVPLLESTMGRRAGWADYARTTNAFFPGRPRR
ncbi:MAG: DUF1295 domain-containing protein [Candidatus Delongbacteria bacterium]